MSFINDDFMLKNKTGKRLFEEYAKDLPIIDYHCHLVPKMIAEDYKFKSTYDLFPRKISQVLHPTMKSGYSGQEQCLSLSVTPYITGHIWSLRDILISISPLRKKLQRKSGISVTSSLQGMIFQHSL